MLREDEFEMWGIVDGIKDGKDSSTWVSDCFESVVWTCTRVRGGIRTDMLDTKAEHHFSEDSTSRQSHKAVISYISPLLRC